jgi:peroxiredoxin
MRRVSGWAGLLAAVALIGVTGFMISGCSSSAEQRSAKSAGDDPGTGTAVAQDTKLAPDFTLNDLEGEPVSLADSTGKVRLIDFWATWCPPCRDEIPMLNDLDRLYRESGLEIVAISDESAEIVRDFVEEHGVTYTNLVGTEDVAADYGVLGLPMAFLLDREGRVVGSPIFGPKARKNLEPKIRELLDLPPET